MSDHSSDAVINSIADLEALYPAPTAAQAQKRAAELSAALQAKLSEASLCTIASIGPQGLDCSPRGDTPGQLVQVLDKHTIAIPDRAGSRRLDTARNVIQNPMIAAWFVSSNWQQSVRIAGHAYVSVKPELRQRFTLDNKVPTTVLVIRIDSVSTHNDRAIRASGLMA